jgi:hypothetical protein
MTDIALIDDDGVTAVFAHSERAKNVTAGIVAMKGLDINWNYTPPMPDGVVCVGAVVLCPCCVTKFGDDLRRAGLKVIFPNSEPNTENLDVEDNPFKLFEDVPGWREATKELAAALVKGAVEIVTLQAKYVDCGAWDTASREAIAESFSAFLHAATTVGATEPE